MEINWRLYSFVRIVLVYMIGIVIADFFRLDWLYVSVFLGISTLAAIIGGYAVGKPQRGTYESGILLMVFCGLGMLRYSVNDPRLSNSHFSSYENATSWSGTIIEYPKTRTRTKAIVSLHTICKGADCFDTKGDVLVYFPKGDSAVISLEPGTDIVFAGKIKEVAESANPMTFDFKSYLYYRKIHYQTLIKETTDYQILSYDNLPFVYLIAHKARAKLLEVLKHYVLENQKYAVASAMMLGYRNQLDSDLYQKFTNSGAVHVLAVSGLHVGIVCSIFYFALSFWKGKSNRVKITKFIILFMVVWSYAIMSGAAPAVVRASMMFTILMVGHFWFDYFKIYNVMAFSALLMLIVNPYLLYQASFQFSFVSLGSIVFFQPIIGKLVQPQSPIMKFVWNMSNIAIAAQVLVFPITVYFFHKFPSYFIITGIFAVPAALVILYLGLGLFIFHFLAYPIAAFIGYFVNLMLNIFIGLIHYIDAMPLSNIEGIWISIFEMMILYVLLFSLMAYVFSRSKRGLMGVGIATCLFVFSMGYTHYEASNKYTLIVYDSYKGSLIDIVANKNIYTFQSEKLEGQDLSYVAKNYRDFTKYQKLDNLFKIANYTSDIKVSYNIAQVNGKQIALIRNASDYLTNDVDIVIFYDGAKLNPLAFQNLKPNTTIILDTTIDRYNRVEWEYFCRENNLDFRSSQGKAVILDL